MAWGNIRVRNACPFPVTFYAIAGPSLELAAGQTSSASACLIWFSTRAKGPGDAINQGQFESFRQEYDDEAKLFDKKWKDWKNGGSGAAAGSFIGWTVGVLQEVFKVKNTLVDGNMYFGAKKEGVYGNSDLVVYATLDPACHEAPEVHKKVWYIHLEKDHGQQTPAGDTYDVPDLSAYKDTLFLRFKNVRHGSYLCIEGDTTYVTVQGGDTPYNPLESSKYWTLAPLEAGGHNLKLLNVKAQCWLVCFDNQVVSLASINAADVVDQHWEAQEVSSNPEVVLLKNIYHPGALVGGDGRVFMYPANASYDDQRWTVETFTPDISRVPPGHTFRIMHCETGRYITLESGEDNHARLKSTSNEDQLFVVEHASNGTFNLRNVKYNVYLTYFSFMANFLGGSSASSNVPQFWSANIADKNAGFQLCCQTQSLGGSNHLYFKDNQFGVYSGDYPDQLWVLQMESMS